MNLSKLLRAESRLLTVLAVALVAGAISGGIALHNNAQKTYVAREACNLLTSTMAKTLGGSGLTHPALKTTKATGTQTSFCVYRGASTSVSLVVRSATSKHGAQLNRQAFSSPPVSSQKVSGYGDFAFWTPSFGQLNILKNDQWYILSNGPNAPTQRTLRQAEQLAAKLAPQL